jgi:hypothetical protein
VLQSYYILHKNFEAEDRLNSFKNSSHASRRALHCTITKINWLKLFKKTINVYTDNQPAFDLRVKEIIVKGYDDGVLHLKESGF